jgi:hypothetical protein
VPQARFKSIYLFPDARHILSRFSTDCCALSARSKAVSCENPYENPLSNQLTI